MSEPLRGVVISHGAVAEALTEAVVRITGERDALVAVSNEGCDRGTLERRLSEATGTGAAVVFVDLPSGSCLQAAVSFLRNRPDVALVAGVNLAMLLDFVYHRETSAGEAATRAVETGARSVRLWEP